MKILFDNIIFSLQKSGGGSMYWYEIINRFNKSKLETSFIEYKHSSLNIFRRHLDLNHIYSSKIPIIIARLIPIFRPLKELHISHSSYYRFSLSKKAINITTIHDFTPEKFFTGFSRFTSYWQKKMAIQLADGIICISQNTKKDLLYFHPKVNPDKIRVIYNGVSNEFHKIDDTKQTKINDEEVKNCLNKKYVLYVGHRTNYKNFFKAAEAMARFCNNIHFVIVGEALNQQEIIKINTILNPKDYTVLSKKNIEMLNALYNKAFCLIYPSSYEGFGIPILEAMKAGCPVITTNKSSIPEVAGNAAIMVKEISKENFEMAIESLEDDIFRNDLINKGYIQSQKFSWDKCYEEVLEFYEYLYVNRE